MGTPHVRDGMNPFLGSVFVFTTLLIAIPSAVKAFNYITTLWQGNLRFTPAMLFSIGLVSTFVTGVDWHHPRGLGVGRERATRTLWWRTSTL